MRKLALPLLVLLLSGICAAQTTTYHSPSPFICDAASLRPVAYFSQFSCRGIKLADSTGSIDGSFFLFSNETVQVALSNIPYPPDTFDSYVTKVDSFTTPSGGNPGTISFDWQVEDANGVFHTGTASGTWVDYVICGGRGCQYHAPKLLTFTTTPN